MVPQGSAGGVGVHRPPDVDQVRHGTDQVLLPEPLAPRARAARRTGRPRWPGRWSERRCAAEWGEFVRPDGHGIRVEDNVLVGSFLEYDHGTERLDRLVTKLGGYAELAEVEPDPVLVLFVLPSHRREAGVRQALTKALAARPMPAPRLAAT